MWNLHEFGPSKFSFCAGLSAAVKAHSKASRLLKRCKNTAGIEGAKWGKWTKGMPPHQGLNPSTQKQKCEDVADGKEYLSSTKSFLQREGYSREELRAILEKRGTMAIAAKRRRSF